MNADIRTLSSFAFLYSSGSMYSEPQPQWRAIPLLTCITGILVQANGTGEDEGTWRVSFYHDGRRARFVVDAQGRIVDTAAGS